MTDIQQYTDLFEQHRELIFAHSIDGMNAKRDAAYDHFRSLGMPTRHTEDYRYTDIRAMLAPDYGLNLRQVPYEVNAAELYNCDVPGLNAYQYYCINDALWHDLHEENPPKISENDSVNIPKSNIERTFTDNSRSNSRIFTEDSPNHHHPTTITQHPLQVLSFRQMAEKNPHFIERYYGQLAQTDADSITALNTMLAQDGIIVCIPRGCRAEKPVQLVSLLHTGREMMLNRRILIVAEEGSDATVMLCEHSAEERQLLTTEVVEVFVEEGASLHLYNIEETHQQNRRISNVYVRQAAGSRFSQHAITLHNGITRQRAVVDLNGEGCECLLNGCVIADKHQHVDNNTLIRHHAARCQSRELYKYVLDDQATGAFAGRIYVKEGAQGTDAQMTNQNLLTNREARMWTQPMLEIYADDVKCAHGSTVGQLNDAALFYMRQRGIPLKEARLLLEQAFINEVTDTIPLLPLRERLRFLTEKRFRGELNKCDGCRLCK